MIDFELILFFLSFALFGRDFKKSDKNYKDNMVKDEEKQEQTRSPLEGMSAEALEVLFANEERAREKRDEALEKIFEYKFKTKTLESHDTALSYKENQALKKDGININNYNVLGGTGDDKTIESLIKVKKLKNYEDAPAYELHFWATRVIMRTIDPMQYEGND